MNNASTDTSNSDTKAEVVMTLILLNAVDAALAERGFRPESCRGCVVDIVASTTSSHLCLPIDIIQKLGLSLEGRMDAQTATGIKTVNIYGWVRFDVDGGLDGIYRCIELPIGQRPILGRVPLEDMGLEIDLDNGILQRVPLRV